MTTHELSSTPGPTASADHPPVPRRSRRLTLAAGWSILVICLLHTLAFAFHPYWDDWLAGPLRQSTPTFEEAVQFWGLPGGFVVPGALLALMILREGHHGRALPTPIGWVLAVWAAACLWVVGPSGFVLVLVPAVLLILASRRRRISPRAPRRGKRTSRA